MVKLMALGEYSSEVVVEDVLLFLFFVTRLTHTKYKYKIADSTSSEIARLLDCNEWGNEKRNVYRLDDESFKSNRIKQRSSNLC